MVRGADKTPEELWSSKKPNLSHLWAYGCTAYALILKLLCGKLDRNSRKCILVGYEATPAHYHLWDLVAKKVIIATNVEFNEAEAPTAIERPISNIGTPLELDSEAYIE